MTIGGESFDIEAWCHRDHSWGERRWDTLLSHRWVSGCAGPALSFGSISWHSVDGNLARFGYVVRDGEVTIAERVDMTVHMACDALTYTGGEVTWWLPGGDVVSVAPKVEAAYLNLHEGIAFVDAVSTFEYEGRTGFCDFEVTANPRGGTAPVTQCLLATQRERTEQKGSPMSQTDVDIIEQFLKAFQAGDVETAFGMIHPDFVIDEGYGLPYAGVVHRPRPGFRRWSARS